MRGEVWGEGVGSRACILANSTGFITISGSWSSIGMNSRVTKSASGSLLCFFFLSVGAITFGRFDLK